MLFDQSQDDRVRPGPALLGMLVTTQLTLAPFQGVCGVQY